MKINWNFLGERERGGGCKRTNLPLAGVWIFSGTGGGHGGGGGGA